MNKTAIAALLAAAVAAPALAQTTTGEALDPNVAVDPQAETTDTDVIVVDEVEVIETEPATTEAATTDATTAQTGSMDMTGMVRADDITGGPIYSTGEAYDDAAWTASDPFNAPRMGMGTNTGATGFSPDPGRLIPMLACFDSPGPFTIHPMTPTFSSSTPAWSFAFLRTRISSRTSATCTSLYRRDNRR